MELFIERGFVETTVPQIAERAGLTTRTFFRHFADKREVLFSVEEQMTAPVAQLIADAPASMSAMRLIEYGLLTMAEAIEGQHPYLRQRESIIRSDAGLQERELQKHAVLARTIASGAAARGFPETEARLIADLSMSVLGIAMTQWLDEDEPRPLAQLVREGLDTARSIVT